MAFSRTEKLQIPGMSDHRDEFNPQFRGEFQGSTEVPDDIYIPPALRSEFHTPSALRQEYYFPGSSKLDYNSPNYRTEWPGTTTSTPVPIPPGGTWDHEKLASESASASRMSPSGRPVSQGILPTYDDEFRHSYAFGDADLNSRWETEVPVTASAALTLQRQLSRSSMAGLARSSSVYAPGKTTKQKIQDYVEYEKGMLESLLPFKAAVAATLASTISFSPFLPDMLRYYGTTATVAVGMTLEPTVGQSLQKGYNLALGSALAACCAFIVFKVEPYTGTYRVPFLILCAFLGGCLPRMYNLPAVIKSRWSQVISYYIIVFHGLVLWNPLTRKQDSQFLFICLCYCIGFSLSVLMGLLIKPDYAGDALLSLLVRNFQTAGNVLERIVNDYKRGLVREKIRDILRDVITEDKTHSDLQFLMTSIAEADKLVTAVYWEPPHGKFYSGYPWKEYPKLLEVLLHVMYDLIAMDSCLRGEIRAPARVRELFVEDMEGVAKECAELFRKIAEGLEQHKLLDYQSQVASARDATRKLRAKLSKFAALVIAQDSAPPARSRSTSVNSAAGEMLFADVVPPMAALSPDGPASTPGTPRYPLTPPSSPHRRFPSQYVEGFPRPGSRAASYPAENWRAELYREQMSTQAHYDPLDDWDLSAKSALSVLKFASILVELMAKVKIVVALIDDFGMKARFASDRT